jgi:Flp pilus assembly pilin Flp
VTHGICRVTFRVTARLVSRREATSEKAETRRFRRAPESGRRGSNPRPSAWEADALPTELRPRPEKVTPPSLQQGIAKKRLQADDLTVRTLLDLHRADGQTMAEYSIILAVITPAIVFTISLLSDRIAALFSALPGLIP